MAISELLPTKTVQLIDQRIQYFNNLAIEMSFAECKEDLGLLLKDCFKLLEQLNEAALAIKLQQLCMDWDALYQLLENYVLENT